VAATHATAVAQNVFDSVHQVVGAVGFTTEFELQRSTMRIPVLLTELGGPASHARAVSRIKWRSAAVNERASA
jgi:alkylation response protein AidB-like acyl-CoA dehydrogenase